MAGIGFELRKILSRDSYTATLHAYVYAGLISSGPWVLSIISVMLVGIISLGLLLPNSLVGQFLVTVKANDVIVDYGKGWPRIEGIQGDLRFEGNGMVVDAQRGTILGAKLSNTHVRIPDFNAPVSTLYVKGQADGPTSEFLKFIDQNM